MPVTGKQGAGGSLMLASSSIDSQVFTVTATTSAANCGSVSSGTYAVAGGCADKDSGTFSGSRVASITGTYASTVQLSSQSGVTATVQFTQAPAYDADGFFDLTGSITVKGAKCFSTGTIQGSPGGILFGTQMVALFAMDDGSALTLSSANAGANGTTFDSRVSIAGGKCDAVGTGTFVKQ